MSYLQNFLERTYCLCLSEIIILVSMRLYYVSLRSLYYIYPLYKRGKWFHSHFTYRLGREYDISRTGSTTKTKMQVSQLLTSAPFTPHPAFLLLSGNYSCMWLQTELKISLLISACSWTESQRKERKWTYFLKPRIALSRSTWCL